MYGPTGMNTHTAAHYHRVAAMMHSYVQNNGAQPLHLALGRFHQVHAPFAMVNGSRMPFSGWPMAHGHPAGRRHPHGFGHAFLRHILFDWIMERHGRAKRRAHFCNDTIEKKMTLRIFLRYSISTAENGQYVLSIVLLIEGEESFSCLNKYVDFVHGLRYRWERARIAFESLNMSIRNLSKSSDGDIEPAEYAPRLPTMYWKKVRHIIGMHSFVLYESENATDWSAGDNSCVRFSVSSNASQMTSLDEDEDTSSRTLIRRLMKLIVSAVHTAQHWSSVTNEQTAMLLQSSRSFAAVCQAFTMHTRVARNSGEQTYVRVAENVLMVRIKAFVSRRCA